MDVQCDHCNSEYEFDDGRIPDTGLSVKCSTCGHVFRVFRAGAGPDAAGLPDGSGAEWMVRQVNGNMFRFRELTTLQRWIVERKVSRDDEISKTGKHWKRLGDIAELATFFQVVAAQPAPAPAPVPQAQPPQQPGYPQPNTNPGWHPGSGPQQQMPQGTGPQQQMPHPPQQGGFDPSSGAAWEATPQPPPGWNQPSGNWQMGAPAQPPPSQTANADNIDLASFPPTAAADDDDDCDDMDYHQGGAGKWIVLLLVLVTAGGGLGAYVYRPDLFKGLFGGGVDKVAASHVDRGYGQLMRDSEAGMDAAIENFNKAITIDAAYADARAGLAEAELARAEYLKEEADALTKTIDKAPDDEKAEIKTRVEALRRESSQRSERAFNAAKESLKMSPEAVGPLRAMGDYYRFKGAIDKMTPLIDKARAAAPKDPIVAYVLGSSVAADKTASERAIRYFDEALEGAPGMNRARYKLARVFLLQGDQDKALLQIKSILKEEPGHERARALELDLEPSAPSPPEPAAPNEPEKKVLTYEQLLGQAERIRQSDRPRKALKLYEKATDMDPEDAEA
ncbi:MAG: zinc-ribbon domain-containing protein, partial [Myxococcota bacterium]